MESRNDRRWKRVAKMKRMWNWKTLRLVHLLFVSKKEAMQTYCLPEGTLAVCSFVEKENPRNKKWAPLKLYNRAEIRRRARERFGGLEGLVKEQQRRVESSHKEMETSKTQVAKESK
jgi:XPA protein C-terminus